MGGPPSAGLWSVFGRTVPPAPAGPPLSAETLSGHPCPDIARAEHRSSEPKQAGLTQGSYDGAVRGA